MLASCGATYVRPDRLDAAEGERFVAVRFGAWLYAAPAADAQHARDSRWAKTPYKVGQAHVYRLLREGPEWLAVQSVAGRGEQHCMWGEPALSKLELQVFVRRADAVRVAVRRARSNYPDGTWIELAAGTPIVDSGPRSQPGSGPRPSKALYTVRSDNMWLNTYLFEQSTGFSYVPSGRYPNTRDDRYVRRKATLRFGGTGVVGTGRYASLLYVKAMSPNTVKPLVIVQLGCLKMRVQVDDDDIMTATNGGLGMLGRLAAGTATGELLPAGAALFWPDGKPAGSVREAVRLVARADSPERMRCYDVPLNRAPKGGSPSADELLTACTLD